MRPLPRAIFGFFAFLPAVGVFGLAVFISTLIMPAMDPTRSSHLAHGTPETSTLVAMGLGIVGIALLQIVMGIVVAIHTSGRHDMTSNEKAAWSLACLFVGSVALPMFFFMKSKPGPR